MTHDQRRVRACHIHGRACAGGLSASAWCAMGIAALWALSHSVASDPTDGPAKIVRRIQFSVEVSNRLLDEPGADLAGFSPGRNVVVAPPALRWVPDGRGKEWLRRHSPFLNPREHKYEVRKGALVPPISIAMVGDVVSLVTPDERVITMQFPGAFGGPEHGDLQVKLLEAFDLCGRLTMHSSRTARVKPPEVKPAYLVVSDHGFGQVTDGTGAAVFDGWPKECDLEAEVFSPFLRTGYELKSDTLRFDDQRRFVVPAGAEAVTHTIQIVPLNKAGEQQRNPRNSEPGVGADSR